MKVTSNIGPGPRFVRYHPVNGNVNTTPILNTDTVLQTFHTFVRRVQYQDTFIRQPVLCLFFCPYVRQTSNHQIFVFLSDQRKSLVVVWLGWGNSTNPEIFKVARIVPTVSVGCLTVLNTYTTYTYRLDGKLVKYRAWGYFFDAQSLEATWTGQPDRLYTLSYCTVFSDRRRNPLPFLVVYCVVMYMNIYERRTSFLSLYIIFVGTTAVIAAAQSIYLSYINRIEVYGCRVDYNYLISYICLTFCWIDWSSSSSSVDCKSSGVTHFGQSIHTSL